MCDVTIAIPVYNVEKYVDKSLRSALEQNFTGTYEVLVIDDCGVDNSMAIVENLAKTHAKGHLIRIVRHSFNKGLGSARNTAIKEAKGRYLFYLDSDDWISENCLSALYSKAVENDAEITCGSVCRIEEKTGTVIKRNLYSDCLVEHKNVGVFMFVNKIDMHIEVWNKLFLLSFIRDNHLECVHKIMEDSVFDFNLRALAQRVCFVSEETLFYNIRENSILTKIYNRKGTDESAFVYCDIINQIQYLIKTKYRNIPGIYDLYYLRLIYSFTSLSLSQYNKVQQGYIKRHIAGFNKFVPGVMCFQVKFYRLLYLCSRIYENYRFFLWLNNFLQKVLKMCK